MQSLTRGANVEVAAPGSTPSLLLGFRWATDLDCDITALVCSEDGKVLDDDWFLFWAAQDAPDRSTFLTVAQQPVEGQDRAQVLVSLVDLPERASRIVVSLATVVDGANLSSVNDLSARVVDLGSGEVRLTAMYAPGSAFSCRLLVELYRRNGAWKVRNIDQGYASGLAGLGRDYGVNIG